MRSEVQTLMGVHINVYIKYINVLIMVVLKWQKNLQLTKPKLKINKIMACIYEKIQSMI
jgi:hypothetical protein